MENFTKNFTYEELIYSPTANRLKLDNTPTEQQKANLKKLAIEILQPIRDAWGSSIVVTSGFRSTKVNKVIGGVSTSQHCSGSAADLKVGGISQNKKLFELITTLIKNGKIQVGQLINEYNYSWIHVSLPRKGKKNNQIFSIK